MLKDYSLKKVLDLIKNKSELIAYTILTVLFFCSLFSPVFTWISAIFAVALAVFWHQETKLVCLMLYVNSFYALFNYQTIASISLDIIIVGFITLMLFGCYVYHVIRNKQKINFKTLIPIILFLIYVILPFHQYNWQDFFAMLFFFIIMYTVFERRKSFDFCRIVRVFVIGIIISCFFAMFSGVSPVLMENLTTSTYGGITRFQGLSFHPNTLNRFIVIAICCLLVLKYKNKISFTEFLFYFIPLFIFGYLTISRSFVFTSFVGIIIFSVFYLVRNKIKALSLISILLCIIFVIGGCFFNISKIYTQRILGETTSSFSIINEDLDWNDFSILNLQETFDNKPEAWKQDVLDGKVFFDPGRPGLNEIYLRDWANSSKSIWFGYGISKPLIGQMSSHNLFIQELWKHGIVGYLFYLAILICSINWKKLKNLKRCLPGLIILVPYLMFTFIEQCLYDYINLMLIVFVFTFVCNNVELEKDHGQDVAKGNISKNEKECFDIS